MRAPLHFMYRDGWSMHIIAEDCKTVLLGYRNVRDEETLLRIMLSSTAFGAPLSGEGRGRP